MLATRVRLATLSGGETDHIQVLAQGILLHVYQLVVLTLWQTGPLGVELPDSLRLT